MRTFIRCKTSNFINPKQIFSYNKASYDLVFPRVVMIQLYDYFWKQISPFSKFLNY